MAYRCLGRALLVQRADSLLGSETKIRVDLGLRADGGFQERKNGPYVYLHTCLYTEAGAYVTIRNQRRLTCSGQL